MTTTKTFIRCHDCLIDLGGDETEAFAGLRGCDATDPCCVVTGCSCEPDCLTAPGWVEGAVYCRDHGNEN